MLGYARFSREIRIPQDRLAPGERSDVSWINNHATS
jgi:hypothetical protein